MRVGQDLRETHPDISAEFLQINFEQRAGVPRLDSWRAFSERIQLDSLRMFVAMLLQTERFGTPIAQALTNFSESLRIDRRQKAEELGIKFRSGGGRMPPLQPADIDTLGLTDVVTELSEIAGHPVKFMLYRSMDDIVARGPAILLPKA